MKRQHPLILSLVNSVVVFLMMAVSINAGTIGQGITKIFNNNESFAREQAERNALRNAVEKVVSVILQSKIRVENYLLINDSIYFNAQRFITSYRIIRNEKKGGYWHVEIDAEVLQSKLKDELGQLRILHKKMGNKRFMVVYHPIHPKALDQKHRAVTTALSAIQNELIRDGFRLFDQDARTDITHQVLPSGTADQLKQSWIRIANANQIDFIIQFELFPTNKSAISDPNFDLRAAWIEIQLKAYDVSTGQLICAIMSEQKKLTSAKEKSYAWENDLAKVAQTAGKVIGKDSTLKIVEYYESVGDIGNSYMITFKGFETDDIATMLDILENLEGYQALNKLQTSPHEIIEYFSTLTKRRLYRLFKGESRREGIRVDRKIKGNRWLVTPELK